MTRKQMLFFIFKCYSPILILISEGGGVFLPRWASNKFWGLRSLCMMPLLCSTSIADAALTKKRPISFQESVQCTWMCLIIFHQVRILFRCFALNTVNDFPCIAEKNATQNVSIDPCMWCHMLKKRPHWGQKALSLGSQEANDWTIAVFVRENVRVSSVSV